VLDDRRGRGIERLVASRLRRQLVRLGE
jgi:hypothetical protein